MSTELDLGWFDPHLGALQRPEATGLSTGLSRAIANRLGVDVILVRVVFVVLAFCAGLGLALYGWGTVLTRGPQGTRPVDQVLPGFRDWFPFAQKAVVVVSTIALIATIGSAFPLSWGAGVLVLIALALLRRRNRRAAAASPQWAPPTVALAPAPHLAGPPTAGPLDDHTLVEQWRRSISDAVGTRRAAVPAPRHLPEVDLYGPEDEEPLPRPAAPQAEAGWLGGLAVMGAMALAAYLISGVFGLSGAHALAGTTAVGGLGAVTFALVSRRRRIPRLILALLSACIVATGWLAAQTPGLAPLDAPGTYSVRVVANDAEVDLRDVDLSQYDTVRVDALLSDVDIILPGPVRTFTTTEWFGDIYDEVYPVDASTEPLDVELQVVARLADVTVKEQP